jgi:hypothetical protein
MLKATPQGWFSYDFTVYDRTGNPVAEVDMANWRESAEIGVGQKRYRAHREGWRSKEFILEDEDSAVVAVAQKPSAWRGTLVFEHAGNRYELKKESAFKSAFVIVREGVGQVGSARRKGVLKPEYFLDIPEDLPLEVRVFVAWLCVLLWKREDEAAASSGGAAGG